MKARVSAKELRRSFSKVITCGTQQPNYLMAFYSPDYYTCGIYGWNFDAYVFGDTLILWGDRGTFGKLVDYDRFQFYEKKAKEIYGELYTKTMDRDSIKNRIDALIKDFIGEVIRG